jgi:large subunit ribosomal protein L6
MSRIGRKPIPVPAGVKISSVSGGKVEVQGPKGKLSVLVPAQIKLEQKDGVLNAPATKASRYGLARHCSRTPCTA